MNEQLQQHLMEFVYGLLDEDEANALCERITSDPQMARAYAKVKLQCDLVGRAARFEAPHIAWIRPESAASDTSPQAASTYWQASGYRRLANWCVGVAASGLICLVGWSYLLSSHAARNETSTVALATTRPAQVVLTGPSKLHGEASNPFTIQVENQAGTPVSTTLNYRVYDVAGGVTWQDAAATDASGIARFDVEPAIARQASHLEITADDDSSAAIQRDLETAPERFVTYLRMDRPLYQPGEEVLYRSVTLTRFGLQSEHGVTPSLEIVNSNDEPLKAELKIAPAKDGVSSGTCVLPSNLTDGTYTLIARSPDNLFSEEWRDFRVRRYATPRLRKKLELARDSYTAGEQVDVDFSVERMAGEPLAEAPLQIQATLDGVPLATPQAKTNAQGNSRFALTLPESIERGEARVSVLVRDGDDPPETITKEIPINLGKVNVDFYPEGGELAAELPSRVYFYGRDPLGKPTHIEGRIVDSNDREMANVVTRHEGRGVFSFTPLADEQYRLVLDKPVGVTKEVSLPATSPTRFATIETGAGVFDANAPITFTLYQQSPVKPLAVAAYCRGAMVGQQNIEPADDYKIDLGKSATFHGEMNLPPEAQGVVRLTVFDATHAPPEPIAERLIYRRVGQKLDVRLTPDAETFVPGQPVQLDVQVRDEHDAPVPAVLGISIVDDAILNLADDKSTRMPTYFHLLTEIDSPQQLEDANFYLTNNSESVAALDSLLGTQGWRRFRDLPATQLAVANHGGFGGGGAGVAFRNSERSSRFRSLAWHEEQAVPISTAATMDVREIVLSQSTRPPQAAPGSRTSFAWPIIIASIVLLVLVGVASLRGAQSNRSLRVFAAGVAVASLIVGVVSLPMTPIRIGQATDKAAPAAVEVAVMSDEPEKVTAGKDAAATSKEADTEMAEGYAFQAGDKRKLSAADEMPMKTPASAMESEHVGQGKEAPQGAARFAQPTDQSLRRSAATADEKSADLSLKKEKKSALPSRDAQPLSAATASPEKPQPAADAVPGRALMPAQPSASRADDVASEFQTREYAKWFDAVPSTIPATESSSTTIFWLPHHVADQTGKASVYFYLPQRPSAFRAIVEAHGAGRLGTGELLIESR